MRRVASIAGLAAAAGCTTSAPPAEPVAEPVRTELTGVLAADSQFAAVVADAGIAAALRAALDESAVLLFPGANVVRGRATILPRLRDVPLDVVRARAAEWKPSSGVVADDATLAMTWGIVSWRADSAGSSVPRAGNYLAAWVPAAPSGWRVAAIVWTAVPAFLIADSVSAAASPAADPGSLTAAERGMWEADVAFASMAGDSGAPAAFARFAAANAFTFAGPGLLRRGPEEIRAGLAAGALGAATWEWGPVFARASADGSLGFTVGEAVIRPAGGDAFHSKYLTIWRRQPDGRYRFLTDAGNARPAR